MGARQHLHAGMHWRVARPVRAPLLVTLNTSMTVGGLVERLRLLLNTRKLLHAAARHWPSFCPTVLRRASPRTAGLLRPRCRLTGSASALLDASTMQVGALPDTIAGRMWSRSVDCDCKRHVQVSEKCAAGECSSLLVFSFGTISVGEPDLSVPSRPQSALQCCPPYFAPPCAPRGAWPHPQQQSEPSRRHRGR
jgi:hypothetical protein